MPKIVFSDVPSLINWLKDMDESKYVIYITENNEIIARPKIDPKSRDFGYVRTSPLPLLSILQDKLPECKIYKVKAYDWKIDMLIREEE